LRIAGNPDGTTGGGVYSVGATFNRFLTLVILASPNNTTL
jgi:hypothetical protein